MAMPLSLERCGRGFTLLLLISGGVSCTLRIGGRFENDRCAERFGTCYEIHSFVAIMSSFDEAGWEWATLKPHTN